MESTALLLEEGQDLFLSGSYQEAIYSYDKVIKIRAGKRLGMERQG